MSEQKRVSISVGKNLHRLMKEESLYTGKEIKEIFESILRSHYYEGYLDELRKIYETERDKRYE